MRWCACRSRLAAGSHHDRSVRLKGCQKFPQLQVTAESAQSPRSLEQLRRSSSGSKRPSTRPRDGVQSRAATGRGAERAQCGDSTSTGGAERLHNNRLHQTCGPVNQLRHVCVEKCPLTTRHVATRTLRGQLREERVLITLEKALAGAVTRRSRADECTIAESQAQREVQNEVSVQTFKACPATYKSGPHVARREPRPCRR